MSINFELEEYREAKPEWVKINRIVNNKKGVKDYLHKLNPNDNSKRMQERRAEFADRAVFSAIASYTARGFLGLVFEQPPRVNIPSGLDYLIKNVDGTGIGVVQQAQHVTKRCISVGRYALWVDYPDTGGKPTSMADLVDGGVFSTIQVINAEDIFFWDYTSIGSEVILSEIRFYSTRRKRDGLELKSEKIIVQLKLNPTYSIRYWVKKEQQAKNAATEEWVEDGKEIVPKNSKGNPLSRIPFIFGGAESNNWQIDPAPMKDLADMNAAHYNDSAVYQDAVLKVSQPQPWMSGVPADQLDEMQEQNWYVGSGRMITVPPGERFEFAQVSENGMGRQAMMDKLEIMIGLGAMFVAPGSAVKTAMQSEGEQRTRHSVLSLIAANVSDSYRRAIGMAGEFMGVATPDEEFFALNQDFVEPNADYNMIREMIAGFMQGALPPEVYHDFLKRNRLADEEQTTEEFMAELATPGVLDAEDGLDMEAAEDDD